MWFFGNYLYGISKFLRLKNYPTGYSIERNRLFKRILEDEPAYRAYLDQVWAEAVEIYKSGGCKLTFSPEMVRHLKEHQSEI